MGAIEITTKIGCKVACVYCPQGQLIKAYSAKSNAFLMDFNAFQGFLDKIPSNIRICFSGMCEPWANHECTRMVLYSHETGHRVSVYTTITGMIPSDVQQLKDIPFHSFVVHLPSIGGNEKIAVNEEYLEVLRSLSVSNIVTQWLCLGEELHPAVARAMGKKAEKGQIFTRAGNIKIHGMPLPERKKGRLRCERNLRQNILLPNGDVLLCCMDYGMKHVLGNLKYQDYESLFADEEFLSIQKGLIDSTRDILCRYCDCFVRNVDIRAKVSNILAKKVKDIRNSRDVLSLIPVVVAGVRKHFFAQQNTSADDR